MIPVQLALLRAYIDSTPALASQPMTSDGAFAIAEALNAVATPAWIVWRTAYTSEQMRAAISVGITQLDALTASKRDSLLWFAQATVDASKASTQAAINDLCGSQNTLKAAVLDGAKRGSTTAEKVLSTGTGSSASPATPTFEGTVTYQDVEAARNL